MDDIDIPLCTFKESETTGYESSWRKEQKVLAAVGRFVAKAISYEVGYSRCIGERDEQLQMEHSWNVNPEATEVPEIAFPHFTHDRQHRMRKTRHPSCGDVTKELSVPGGWVLGDEQSPSDECDGVRGRGAEHRAYVEPFRVLCRNDDCKGEQKQPAIWMRQAGNRDGRVRGQHRKHEGAITQ